MTDVLDANGVKIGEELDLVNSIYIDWGAFISAIINFLLIALVLFAIVKIINRINEAREDAEEEFANTRKAMKEIKRIKKQQKVSYQKAQELYRQQVAEKKAEIAAANALAAEKAAEEARLAEEKANANTLLLQEILQVLKNK
jgi:large conductance mechanosensitive channel